DKDIYNVKLNAKMNIMVENKESNLVPSIIASEAFSMLDGKEAFEFQSNPKAPLGLTYLLKIKNNPFNPQETQVIHPGTEFRVSSLKQFHIVVKLPNGREQLVYKRFSDDEYVLNQPFDVQNDISRLFADYQRGQGLSNGVTQAIIDEIRIKVENFEEEGLKKESQERLNKAQMLLNLKPNYTTYYKKEIHNAYTFEFQTNSKAPSDVMYKLSDLAKPERESWEIIGKKGPNEAWWLDYLPSGKQYDLVAQLPDGTEYVIHEQK
ncbi:hypothetical protein ABE193_24910, partial [Bacillus mycoides]